jgi:ligand-binding SRPBCC domain-containing protein
MHCELTPINSIGLPRDLIPLLMESGACEYASLKKDGTLITTVVDEDGYPLPFRVRGGSLGADGVHLELPSAMPVDVRGCACLTFHTMQVQKGEMVSNENMSFVGEVSGDGADALFKVEAEGEWVEYEENRRFGFRQIQGEMKRWEGAITFEPTEKGTKVTTNVDYELPYWVLGMIMDKLVVGKSLQRLYSSFDEGAKEILEGA